MKAINSYKASMKWNEELAFQILQAVEELGFAENMTSKELVEEESVESSNYEEILYHVKHLSDAGYLETTSHGGDSGYGISMVYIIDDLTLEGHRYLADLRADREHKGSNGTRRK